VKALDDCLPRLLFLDHSGNLGGAEYSLKELILPYVGNSSVLLLEDGPFRQLLEDSAIPVIVYAMHLNRFNRQSGPTTLIGSHSLLAGVLAIAKYGKDFDLICTNTLKAGILGLIAGRVAGVPVLVCLHDILSAEHFSRFNRQVFVWLCRMFAVRIVANSRATAEAYMAAGGSADKVRIVYPGFDAVALLTENDKESLRRQLRIAPGCSVVGCFSRIARWKGQHILLEAVAELERPVCLLICGAPLFGEDEWLAQLRSQAAQLGLQEKVRFLGFRQDVGSLMQICDVVVHPSILSEPFGRTIVEAQLLGRCVIATRSGGPLEIIEHGKTGLLVSLADKDALAGAIRVCIDDPALAESMGAASQARASARFNSVLTRRAFASVLAELFPSMQSSDATSRSNPGDFDSESSAFQRDQS
jgi:glycosyltransferase involved in cell wall biosynthesis